MNMKQKKSKVFLDSSVIIAGLASGKGGSHEVLALAELGIIVPCISEKVVCEVIRNVQKKLPDCAGHFYTLFKKLPFRILEASDKDLDYAGTLINVKDAPILAAAISGNVEWLLSLDKHFLSIGLDVGLCFNVCTPGSFLKNFFR